MRMVPKETVVTYRKINEFAIILLIDFMTLMYGCLYNVERFQKIILVTWQEISPVIEQ
jgi:hypothetical protein